MLWLLHGFLGSGNDWDGVRSAWPEDLPAVRSPDLFARGGPEESLEEFGERFARLVAATDPEPILVGYSLGGRLALHALVAAPARWRAAAIVSSHLGLPDAGAREERRAADAAWAERFRSESWPTLLDAWNARDVFAGRAAPLPRPEDRFDRVALARALDRWSLGNQADLRPQLAALPMPILWIAGADDRRYVTQGELAAACGPSVTLRIAPHAAHRVPWETPDWFVSELSAFVRGLPPA